MIAVFRGETQNVAGWVPRLRGGGDSVGHRLECHAENEAGVEEGAEIGGHYVRFPGIVVVVVEVFVGG